MKFPIPLALLALAISLFVAACGRPVHVSVKFFTPPPTPAPGEHAAASHPSPTPVPPAPPTLPEFAVDAVSTREGVATWYEVPEQSLPERRAWSGEMTAASDTLALNTYVRVRRIDKDSNGKSVVVRITDHGLHRRGTLIDLNREAAETLDMVQKGAVRVRLEILALKNADARKPVDEKNSTPTAAKITATPAATKDQERENAAAKAGGATPP